MADEGTDPLEVLEHLKEATQAFEGYHRTHFVLYRNRKDGSVQHVEVEVLDAGPGERNRYSIHARSEDGKVASGNPQATLHAAISLVHWGVLG